MILSMTGYGKGTSSDETWQADVEVRSVNSRYLEILLKFPPMIADREYEIREIVKSKIKRGKINLSIQLKKNDVNSNSISIDEDKLRKYLATIKKIKKAAKISDKIKLEHILNSREIFISNIDEITDSEFNVIKDAVLKSLDQLITMKKREGSELQKDLKKRIRIIEQNLDIIETESQSSVSEHHLRYKERIKNLLEDQSVINNDRLETELALIAERADITEECVRLRSHIKFFTDSLTKEEDPGRKLNFLCQEMNRETNTISSKTLSTSITHNSVHIKEEIERIREQVQNIE